MLLANFKFRVFSWTILGNKTENMLLTLAPGLLPFARQISMAPASGGLPRKQATKWAGWNWRYTSKVSFQLFQQTFLCTIRRISLSLENIKVVWSVENSWTIQRIISNFQYPKGDLAK